MLHFVERFLAEVADLYHVLLGAVDEVFDGVDSSSLQTVEGLGICDCGLEEIAFCGFRNDQNGSCENLGCCLPENLYTIDNTSVCCPEGEVGVCSEKTDNGSCRGLLCCSPNHIRTLEGLSRCCPEEGDTVFCAVRNEDGTCKTLSACGSADAFKLVGGTSTYWPAENPENTYCKLWNQNGTCHEAMECPPERVQTVEGVSECCGEGKVAHCISRDAYGKCLRAWCCGDQEILISQDGINACAEPGSSVLCSERYPSGICHWLDVIVCPEGETACSFWPWIDSLGMRMNWGIGCCPSN